MALTVKIGGAVVQCDSPKEAAAFLAEMTRLAERSGSSEKRLSEANGVATGRDASPADYAEDALVNLSNQTVKQSQMYLALRLLEMVQSQGKPGIRSDRIVRAFGLTSPKALRSISVPASKVLSGIGIRYKDCVTIAKVQEADGVRTYWRPLDGTSDAISKLRTKMEAAS